MIHQCRLALRELGQRVSQRSGGEVDDLWFIRLEEMDAFLQKPETMKKIISERKATREALSELVPPFCFSGELPPIETWEKRKEIARTALKPGEMFRPEDMRRRGQRLRVVQGHDQDVDLVRPTGAFIAERRAAGATESARHIF